MTSTVRGRAVVAILIVGLGAGCRASDLLTVRTPPNLVAGGQLGDSTGAESLRAGTMGEFETAIGSSIGQVGFSGILADEFAIGYSFTLTDLAVDARAINANGITSFDHAYGGLQATRRAGAQAAAALERAAPTSTGAEVAELFAIVGYTKILLGESMCSGIPMSEANPDGTIAYGEPLPTDSVFGRALANFDSAAAHAGGTTTVANLIAVGRGRALVDLGRFSEAATSAAGVPASFVYKTLLANASGVAGFYRQLALGYYTTGDHKGQNGLDFVSAHDPRVPTQNIGATSVGTPLIYPLQFPLNLTANDSIPLADGVEAQLIVAEAALARHDIGTWMATLNQLRASYTAVRGPYPSDTSYHVLGPLSDPGNDSGRVSLMFRERAFWLFGTGHRLGDLRRLIRQYGRDQRAVFPNGPYVNGTATFFSSYGATVNFPIGSIAEQGNPKFLGCSGSTA